MGFKHLMKKMTGRTPEQKEKKKNKKLINDFYAGAIDAINRHEEEQNQLAYRQEQEDKLDAMDMQVSEPSYGGDDSDFVNKGDELMELRRVLARSAKGGGGNDSAKYQAIDILLLQIGNLMDQKFGAEDASEDVNMLTQMMVYYGDLMVACDDYLNRKARTKAGKARQGIVSTIRSIAERDSKGMGKALDELPTAGRAERSKMTWQQLLKTARTDKYTIPSMTAATGGQASEIYMFDNPDKSSKTKKLFFKPEEKLDYKDSFGTWIIGKYREMHPEEKIDEKTIEAWKRAQHASGDAPQPVFASDEDKSLAKNVKDWKSIEKIYGSLHTQMFDVFKTMGINSGSHDVTGRNVATSRIADILGLDNLVARSKFAEVDDGKGNKRKGIVMEGVSGQDGLKFQQDFGMKANGHKKGDAEFADKKYAFENFDQYQGKDDMFQPSFFRDIISLQVLDCICGQVDRHGGNMFMQTDNKGRFVSIKGIDNDAAFGNNIDTLGSFHSRNDKEVYDEDGNLAIPYIDANLAERVKALSPHVLRMALGDIIGTKEIDSAIERLNKLKSAISNAPKEKILQNEQDWSGKEVKDKMMAGARGDDERTANIKRYQGQGYSEFDAKDKVGKAATYMANFKVHEFQYSTRYDAYRRERDEKKAGK